MSSLSSPTAPTAPDANLGVQIDLHAIAPGPVNINASNDHRLRIHAGAPVRGTCSDNQVFRYERGDLDIIPAGQSDAWQVDAESVTLEVQVSPMLLRRASDDMGLSLDGVGLEPRHQFRDPQIEHIAWALDAERSAGYPGGRLYTDALGLALAVRLLGQYGIREVAVPRGLSRPQLRRLTAFIEAHLDQDLSLARLSAVAGVSASHLKTLFRRASGLTVHEYVVQRRVERAKALLIAGELPLSQVALEAGFAHQSHMARHMRRLLGVTPGVIARSARGHSSPGQSRSILSVTRGAAPLPAPPVPHVSPAHTRRAGQWHTSRASQPRT